MEMMMRLDDDMVLHILGRLDSDEDIARVSAVCRCWHRLVVEGRLWRRLCMNRFPELEDFQEVAQQSDCAADSTKKSAEYRDREHRVFCDLFYNLTRTPSTRSSYIANALSASSTDNSPNEDVSQTLYPRPKRSSGSPSYWSSTGQKLETVPEFLTYRLVTPLCVVDEIKLRPFEAYFQIGRPIYSSKLVRFKFGYQRSSNRRGHSWNDPDPDSGADYVWKYVSPLYTVEQANALQTFRLPRPVVCVGGIFQVELIGRIQKQSTDQLYYICICHVSVQGRALDLYDFEIKKPDCFVLKSLDEPHHQAREADVEEEEDVGRGDQDEEVMFHFFRPDLIMWGRPIFDVDEDVEEE